MKIRFYSDTNYSHVRDAFEQYNDDAPVEFNHLDVVIPEDWYDANADFVTQILSEYSGDIYW